MTKIVVPIGAVAVLAAVLSVGWLAEPDRFARGYAPEQPVPYSHKLHAGTLHIACQYCHTGVDKSRHAGVPAVETCMNCHRVTKTDSPAIKTLTAIYESGKPMLWKRIHSLPDHVYFDHRPHVISGIACQTCHGEVQEMDVVTQHMSMRMGNCLGCHRNAHEALPEGSTVKRGPEHCTACHR